MQSVKSTWVLSKIFRQLFLHLLAPISLQQRFSINFTFSFGWFSFPAPCTDFPLGERFIFCCETLLVFPFIVFIVPPISLFMFTLHQAHRPLSSWWIFSLSIKYIFKEDDFWGAVRIWYNWIISKGKYFTQQKAGKPNIWVLGQFVKKEKRSKLYQEFWCRHCAANLLERNWCTFLDFPLSDFSRWGILVSCVYLCLMQQSIINLSIFTFAWCNKVSSTYPSLQRRNIVQRIVFFSKHLSNPFASLVQTRQTEKLNFERKFEQCCLTICWRELFLTLCWFFLTMCWTSKICPGQFKHSCRLYCIYFNK